MPVVWRVIAAVLVMAAPWPAAAQLQQTTVTAVVLDAQLAPLAGADVTLRDPLGAELQRARTDAAGRVVFAGVAIGRYQLTTTTVAAPVILLPVRVSSSLPIEITLRVPAAITDRVTVEGVHDDATSRGSLGAESIARVPSRVRSRALQEVLATLPGWSTEDNGLVHTRGVDDGFLYVIDGIPVYERLDALSGIAPDVSSIASLNVVTGYIPPEYGYKSGGVIDVRSSIASEWAASADVVFGDDAARDASAALGGRLRDSLAARVGGSWMTSDRYLDPIHPDNLHNTGGQADTFGQVEWVPRETDRITAGWGAGAARFDVPNSAEQHRAGQHQRQRIGQAFANLNWQRTWSSDLVMQAAAYHRRTGAELEGSAFDTPLAAAADRSLNRTGLLVAATRQHNAHLVKTGFEVQRLALDEYFRFAITDPEEAQEAEFREEALVFTPANPFVFRGAATPTLFSAYVQDTWQAAPHLTLSGGVRFDRSQLLLTRSQLSPRAGAALRVSDTSVLRLSISRFFQPPQAENLLLSSSPEARVLSTIVVDGAEGGADIEPERQWGLEVGAEHQIGIARVDAAYWRRWIRNAADPNVFAGTTIIFPNAVASGRAHGLELRLEVPRHRQWSGYANWSIGRVVQTGPINGGLFLEDEVEDIGPGVEFAPDHDQRYTAGAGVTWEHARSRAAVSFIARYESGTPVPMDDDELDEFLELPGIEFVDLAAGRVRPRTVASLLATMPMFTRDAVSASVGVQVMNLLNARYAYNFGNPFSGTHFGAPRSVAVSVRLQFR
jgi:outer membrane receptor protein involved in Fe transport